MTINRSRLGAIGLMLLSVAALRGRLRRYVIAEDSMSGSLEHGDHVLAVSRRGRLERGRLQRGRLQRGDVVVYRDPLDGRQELVKRIVGLPGETITIANGQVHVDGVVLAEHWADGPTMPDGSWHVAGGHVFLLGDVRSRSSHDSRQTGPVPSASIEWRIVARYWPIPGLV